MAPLLAMFRLFCDFDGRIGRAAFWAGGGAVALMLHAVESAAPALGADPGARAAAFAAAFALFPWAALAAKRAADRGRPRAWGIGLVATCILSALAARLWPDGGAPGLGLLALAAWCIALVDLGLMAGRGGLAAPDAAARPGP